MDGRIIGKKFGDMHYAYKENDSAKLYMCDIISYLALLKLYKYQKYEREHGEKLPLLPIIDMKFKDKVFIFYERALSVDEIGDFNARKIVNIMEKITQFNNETGFRASSALFIKNKEVFVKPTAIEPFEFLGLHKF